MSKENSFRPAFPFTINIDKNIIYCEVCKKHKELPENYEHSKKPAGYFDSFKKKHLECKEIWKKIVKN